MDACTLLSPILWYFFSMMVLTGSSSLNVMKQKPLLLFVLFSIGSSMDSTWSFDHITIDSSAGQVTLCSRPNCKITLSYVSRITY